MKTRNSKEREGSRIPVRKYLVTAAPRDPGRGGENGFGIDWMDSDGHRELLAWDDLISCNQPVPPASRKVSHIGPEPVVRVKYT